jgi:C_GCAxxG_C_C family probable redox protein
MEKALAYFNGGFNCSQAILSAYSPRYGLDAELAQRIACGFGAGMGRLGETCGAVTGAYMLISLIHGDDRERTYELVREFSKRFIEHNGSTECRTLLNVDLITGDAEFASRQVAKICPNMVKDAAEILEELLDL